MGWTAAERLGALAGALRLLTRTACRSRRPGGFSIPCDLPVGHCTTTHQSRWWQVYGHQLRVQRARLRRRLGRAVSGREA